MAVSLFSPAKINLFLAVTGRREDGYHDLVSVAAPLDFGDELELTEQDPGAESRFTLECDDPTVPSGETNLVLKAAQVFAAATGWPIRQAQGRSGGVHFKLTKRIPVGAGLGGGSSNAVAALRGLNQLSGGLLSGEKLAEAAAALGSDCALFLAGAPVVMRGRGERIAPLPAGAADRLRGRRVLLLKPGFGISTPWAYQRMVARGTDYLPATAAEAALAAWSAGRTPAEELLFNNMTGAAYEKFPALPVLLQKLRSEFGVAALMSGSGSACFALLGDPSTGSGQAHPADVVTRMEHFIRECWGPPAFIQEARLT